MYRPISLAAIVIVLAPVSGFAQPAGAGGRGMGGRGGIMMMDGPMIRAGQTVVRRTAQVEMAGSHRLIGQLDFRPLTVEGDLGRYAIMPDRIKMIRFLKPANDDEAANAARDGSPNPRRVAPGLPRARAGAVMQARSPFDVHDDTVNDPITGRLTTITRGKIVTTTGQEIIGMIYIPKDFHLELEFGTLFLEAPRLRSITFTDAERTTRPAQAGEATDQASTPPRYFRHEHSIIVASPAGDRVTLIDLETKRSQSLELGASKDASLEVMPVLDLEKHVVALALKGPKITRIAVADLAGGTWHPQDLREPVEGRAMPVVAPGLVVYHLGRYAYAYSAEAQRWDVVELPERLRAEPDVGPKGATIEGHGHIYSFIPKTGKWEHIDVRGILDTMGTEPRK